MDALDKPPRGIAPSSVDRARERIDRRHAVVDASDGVDVDVVHAPAVGEASRLGRPRERGNARTNRATDWGGRLGVATEEFKCRPISPSRDRGATNEDESERNEGGGE